MRKSSRLKVIAIVLALAGGASCARHEEDAATRSASMETEPGPSAPEVAAILDLGGKEQFPLSPEFARARMNVVLFLATECPISNTYAPEIGRLLSAYHSKGVAFYIVYSDPDLTAPAAREHVTSFGHTCPAILDPQQRLARAVGAHVTPEAALIARSGEVVYRGRIDNLYAALGKRRFEPTTHELRDALDSVLAGSPVRPSRTEAIGCEIPGIVAMEKK